MTVNSKEDATPIADAMLSAQCDEGMVSTAPTTQTPYAGWPRMGAELGRREPSLAAGSLPFIPGKAETNFSAIAGRALKLRVAATPAAGCGRVLPFEMTKPLPSWRVRTAYRSYSERRLKRFGCQTRAGFVERTQCGKFDVPKLMLVSIDGCLGSAGAYGGSAHAHAYVCVARSRPNLHRAMR
jgi:hypothetical protein